MKCNYNNHQLKSKEKKKKLKKQKNNNYNLKIMHHNWVNWMKKRVNYYQKFNYWNNKLCKIKKLMMINMIN